IATMMDRFGAVDVLVNNTGINPVYGPLMDADLGAVRKTFDTNVTAALGYIQLAHRAHMGAHGGAVVNIASVAGLRSTGVIPAYGASKAALIRLTEELAWELAPKIRVNAVAPGIVRTDFARVLVEGREAEAVAPYPLGRLGTPEDIARAVAFLASDRAEWITGETLRVDGGWLATGGPSTGPHPVFHLVVVGLGPAWRALAHRAAAAGLDVAAVDPAPERVWTQTFGMWADEWPAWLPAELIAARLPRPAVATPAVRTLTRTYLIVDTAGLHRTLALDRVTVHPARAAELTDTTVVLRGGERICGRHVVDARGLRAGSGAAEQTAFGVILPTAEAIGALGGQAGWFMDWRRDNGAAPEAAPSFLYAVPLGGDRVLLEETCLARRPALGLPELRSRLLARLDARGVTVPADPETEKVRFPLYRTGPEAA